MARRVSALGRTVYSDALTMAVQTAITREVGKPEACMPATSISVDGLTGTGARPASASATRGSVRTVVGDVCRREGNGI